MKKKIIIKKYFIKNLIIIIKYIINISNENINKHNLHYLNNSTDFLLISKNVLFL